MVNKKLTTILIALTLSGCCSMAKKICTDCKPTVITVEKIVEVKTAVGTNVAPKEDTPLPLLPIASLQSTSLPDEVIKAYAATVEILKTEVKTLRKNLEEYRKPPEQ